MCCVVVEVVLNGAAACRPCRRIAAVYDPSLNVSSEGHSVGVVDNPNLALDEVGGLDDLLEHGLFGNVRNLGNEV